ncbi:MAG TPA: hypothetical protein VFT34_14570 [Verrucomicrobiae bacterium]|nr:hypothetical protein [Verrucomicrobiae bacterium]
MRTDPFTGDGLAVNATADGARLRCVFQKLEAEVTAAGLWLRSTAPGAADRAQVVAARLRRDAGATLLLERRGGVDLATGHARYIRSRLIEEYSVSVDGIRQDFLVTDPPAGTGPLRLELALPGARAEVSPDGAQLVLNESGRKLNYNRLRVTDATGRELAAWMELISPTNLAVVVEDAGAVYPLRIDPTFSDANWSSMGVL